MTDSYTHSLGLLVSVFNGSDGDATGALYKLLETRGPAGLVAIELFRAQKASARAKEYRRSSARALGYDRKEWALGRLCELLETHAAGLGLVWGWGVDALQDFHRHVLYVDLPNGQVSFHAAWRGRGPDYPAPWDGRRGVSISRICTWIAHLLSEGAGA